MDSAESTTPSNRKRPNIVLISSHDSGRYFGCYGVKTVTTPALDALAADGVLFEQMSAASPICSPSRGAMLTGRWPQRNGLLGLTHHGFRLHASERHLASLLGEAGYESVLFHFQHVAEQSEWKRLGYEKFLARSRDEEEQEYPYMARTASEVAGAFKEFIAKRKGDSRPLFAHINFNETHTPFHFGGVLPDKRKGVTVPQWIQGDAAAHQHFAHLQGSIASLDVAIGQIQDGLRVNHMEQDTVVIFATDHGFEGVRDKWSLYEAGLGVAFVMRYPEGGITGGRRIAEPASHIDLCPTLLELAGAALPNNLDGRSLLPVLRSESAPDPQRPVFAIYHNSGIRSVRIGDWKLIRNYSAEPYREHAPVTLKQTGKRYPRPPIELYDLSKDPHELHNIAALHPDVVTRMDTILNQWMQSVGDPILPTCVC